MMTCDPIVVSLFKHFLYFALIKSCNQIQDIIVCLLMFRTKSLNSKELTQIINKRQKSKAKKVKTKGSLRDLIADKTVRYRQNLDKLAIHDSNIPYSAKKSNKKYQSCQQDKVKVQQFQCDFENTIYEALETERYDEQLHNTSTFNIPQAAISQTTEKTQYDRNSTYQKSLQQTHQQISLLRQQCQIYRQAIIKLQNEKIQYKEQIQQLHLSIQRLSLVNQELKDSVYNDKKKRNAIYGCQNISISNIKAKNMMGINTDLSSQALDEVINQNQDLQKKLKELQEQKDQVVLYLYYSANNKHKIEQSGVEVEDSDCRKYLSVLQLVKENNQKNRQIYSNEIQLFKEVNAQIKRNYDSKITHLSTLLGMAQEEIKKLLKKLRENQEMTINQHKNRTQQIIQNIMEKKKKM